MTSTPETFAPTVSGAPRRALQRSPAAVVFSLLVHAVLVWRLSAPQVRLPKPPPLIVELAPARAPEKAPDKPPEQAPEPPPRVNDTPAPRAERAARAPQRPAEPPINPSPQPPVAAAPIDLRGVAFSNAGVAVPLGSVVSAQPETGSRATPPSVTPRPRAVSTVPLSDLSKKPSAPRLDDALRRNYPPRYRQTGTAGHASVRVSLSEHGRVTGVRITTESAAGFGEACKRTLLQSQWSAPLDRDGQAVRTELTYRCNFSIDG